MTATQAIEALAGVCDTVIVGDCHHRHVSRFTGESSITREWTVTTWAGEVLTAQKSGKDLAVLVEAARAEHLRKTGKLCGEWDPVLLGA